MEWSVEVVFKLKNSLAIYGLEIEEVKVNNLLNELKDAIENEDYILISDLLQYEILEILKEWKSTLEKIDFNAQ